MFDSKCTAIPNIIKLRTSTNFQIIKYLAENGILNAIEEMVNIHMELAHAQFHRQSARERDALAMDQISQLTN